jgi:uncharacterized membrane protein
MGADVNGLSYASAKAINAAGVAVGEVSKYDASGTPIGNVAVRWDASGVAATELGHLGADAPIGYGSSRAFAINSSGTVLGTQNVYDESGNYLKNVPVRWDATGAPTELGTLDSSNTTTVVSSPAALNDAGVAVGWANKRGVDHLLGERAVRWDASSSAAIELGTLTPSVYGIMYSQASAVNDAGTVVGWSDKYDPTGMTWLGERAVYWGADTIAIDLNTLIDPSSGWLLTHALEISDTGWIVGEGMFDADGVGGRAAYSRHFLMQVPATVPEPGVLSFFGLLLPALLRRRTARRRLPIAAHHLSDAEIAPLKIGR